MNKEKRVLQWIVVVLLAAPAVLCLGLMAFFAFETVHYYQRGTEAQARLNSALQAMPAYGAVHLVTSASGRISEGTVGCVSYQVQQVYGTNEMSLAEVFYYYTSTLPLTGWSWQEVDPTYIESPHPDWLGFSRGEVRMEIAAIGDVYGYYLRPFFDLFTDSRDAYTADLNVINAAKKQYRTVFKVSLVTFPPAGEQNEGCNY